jgi:hypothetical protein
MLSCWIREAAASASCEHDAQLRDFSSVKSYTVFAAPFLAIDMSDEGSNGWGMTVMPPPAGVLPDPSDDMRVQNITCHAVCLTLVTLAMVTRIYTRKFITNTLGLDDGKCT